MHRVQCRHWGWRAGLQSEQAGATVHLQDSGSEQHCSVPQIVMQSLFPLVHLQPAQVAAREVLGLLTKTRFAGMHSAYLVHYLNYPGPESLMLSEQ